MYRHQMPGQGRLGYAMVGQVREGQGRSEGRTGKSRAGQERTGQDRKERRGVKRENFRGGEYCSTLI